MNRTLHTPRVTHLKCNKTNMFFERQQGGEATCAQLSSALSKCVKVFLASAQPPPARLPWTLEPSPKTILEKSLCSFYRRELAMTATSRHNQQTNQTRAKNGPNHQCALIIRPICNGFTGSGHDAAGSGANFCSNSSARQ